MRTEPDATGVALGVAVLFAGLATNAGIDAAVDRAGPPWSVGPTCASPAFGEPACPIGTRRRRSGHARRGRRRAGLRAADVPRRPILRRRATRCPRPVTIAGIDPAAEAALHDLPSARDRPLAGESATERARQRDARSRGWARGRRHDRPSRPSTRRVHLRIVGILAGDGPWAGGGGRAVVVPLETAQTVFGTDGLTRVDIGLADGRTRRGHGRARGRAS